MQDKLTFTVEETDLIGKVFLEIKNYYLDDSEKIYPPKETDCIVSVYSQEEIKNIYSIIEKLT